MEFDENRRMYSINIGDHSHPIGFGNHNGTPIHLHQTQTIQTEHAPRLLVGSVLDGAVVAISPQVAHHPLQQNIHHTVMPQQTHLTQQNHHLQQMSQQSIAGPNHIQGENSSQPHMISVALSSSVPSEGELRERAILNTENLEMLGEQCQNVVESSSTATNTVANRGCSSDMWCLVCNENIHENDWDEVINIRTVVMGSSQRKLSTLIKKLCTISTKKMHSSVICQQCFSSFVEIDAYEVKLANAKMNVLKQLKTTFSNRQPNFQLIVDKIISEAKYVRCDSLSESSDDSVGLADDPTDPDVTLASLKNPRKKPTKKHKKKLAGSKDKKTTAGKVSKRQVFEMGQRRGRGRPRKKEKDEEDNVSPGEPSKECPCCQKVVPAKKYLSHLSKHRVFPCPFCLAAYRKKDIKVHLAEAHQEEVHYPCTECDQVFDSFTQLRKHCLIVHMGVELEREHCSLCSKSFSSCNALKVHIETIHTKAQVYECRLCKESFNQRGNMRNHYRRIHQGVEARKLVCSMCSKGFICPSDLRKHVERVHLKIRKNEVMCKVCGKSFSDSRALKIHVNAIHTKEVQYPCPDCRMVFHSLTNMVTHKRRMHNGNEARKHICTVCNKGFCSPSDLRTHVKVVHENVRKFVCEICNQSFKVGSHLKYHLRKHTGETPYDCPHCDKSFHGPSHISDHIKKVHKTVYMGVNQRRKLNLPDDAPPPPPGILVPHTRQKHKPIHPPQEEGANIPVIPSQVIIQSLQPQQHELPGGTTSAVATIPAIQHSHLHPHNMMQFTSSQPNHHHMIQTSAAVMETHHTVAHNPYANIQFEQTNNTQSPVPMVVRLLHDMQY